MVRRALSVFASARARHRAYPATTEERRLVSRKRAARVTGGGYHYRVGALPAGPTGLLSGTLSTSICPTSAPFWRLTSTTYSPGPVNVHCALTIVPPDC